MTVEVIKLVAGAVWTCVAIYALLRFMAWTLSLISEASKRNARHDLSQFSGMYRVATEKQYRTAWLGMGKAFLVLVVVIGIPFSLIAFYGLSDPP